MPHASVRGVPQHDRFFRESRTGSGSRQLPTTSSKARVPCVISSTRHPSRRIETLSTWSPIVPFFQPFLPCTFIATAPPSVTCIVPVTTGGQNPRGIDHFQRSPSVRPAPARTIPEASSKPATAFRLVISTTGPAEFVEASPYERPAPRNTGFDPFEAQVARASRSASSEPGRKTGDTETL